MDNIYETEKKMFVKLKNQFNYFINSLVQNILKSILN